MTKQEKKETIEFAVKVANKRVPIIAGTGGNNTISSIQMSQYAESIRSRCSSTCNTIL